MLHKDSFFYDVYEEDYKMAIHELVNVKRSMEWMKKEMDKLSEEDNEEFKEEVRVNSIKLKAKLEEINKLMVEIRQK